MPSSAEADEPPAERRADLLLDTSAAIALVVPTHERHEAVTRRVVGLRLGLAGHASAETYSVLTRLPGEQRLSGPAAARVIATDFPAPALLSRAGAAAAIPRFAEAGIAGGAVYDGLVALAAAEAGVTLLSCDRRALGTYAALGAEVELS